MTRFVAAATLWLCGSISPVRAEEVTLTMPHGFDGLATYLRGEPGKPAVVLAHGFLQTRHFPTVARLSSTLHENGYTVLLPTLTLRVPQRQQSLGCDAVHSHRMGESVGELVAWVEFLREHGHDHIVLFGHSYGGIQAIAAARRLPGLAGVVGISLADAAHNFGSKRARDLVQRVREHIRSRPGEVRIYRLSHCPRYPAPPAAYLSYVRWDRARILANIRALESPLFVIVGQADQRMGADWPNQLQAAGAHIRRIAGANHFFNAMHEFDLADQALSILSTIEADLP